MHCPQPAADRGQGKSQDGTWTAEGTAQFWVPWCQGQKGELSLSSGLLARPTTRGHRVPTAQWVKGHPPTGASGDTHHPRVGHGLELQGEDPLLPGLSRCAGHGRTVVVGQEKAVALSSCPAQGSDILVT